MLAQGLLSLDASKIRFVNEVYDLRVKGVEIRRSRFEKFLDDVVEQFKTKIEKNFY